MYGETAIHKVVGKKQKKSFTKRKIISIMMILCLAGSALGCDDTKSTTKSRSTKVDNSNVIKKEVKTRQVEGTAADLGTGTFTVGKDIEEGVYDAAPADGQGNFIIQNAKGEDLDVNEILSGDSQNGVSKVRVKLIKDEQIQLESINKTHFEPVTAQFVTDCNPISLYSGRWVVGEDIGKGRYSAAPAGGSGNFVVYDKSGMPKTNEILGEGGVNKVTVNLDDGDIITIISLNQVNLTPSK